MTFVSSAGMPYKVGIQGSDTAIVWQILAYVWNEVLRFEGEKRLCAVERM
jgi:hypothetical protein